MLKESISRYYYFFLFSLLGVCFRATYIYRTLGTINNKRLQAKTPETPNCEKPTRNKSLMAGIDFGSCKWKQLCYIWAHRIEICGLPSSAKTVYAKLYDVSSSSSSASCRALHFILLTVVTSYNENDVYVHTF